MVCVYAVYNMFKEIWKKKPYRSGVFFLDSGTALKKHNVIYSKWKLLDSIYCFLILELIQYTILTFWLKVGMNIQTCLLYGTW